jgi:hypothetical protein
MDSHRKMPVVVEHMLGFLLNITAGVEGEHDGNGRIAPIWTKFVEQGAVKRILSVLFSGTATANSRRHCYDAISRLAEWSNRTDNEPWKLQAWAEGELLQIMLADVLKYPTDSELLSELISALVNVASDSSEIKLAICHGGGIRGMATLIAALKLEKLELNERGTDDTVVIGNLANAIGVVSNVLALGVSDEKGQVRTAVLKEEVVAVVLESMAAFNQHRKVQFNGCQLILNFTAGTDIGTHAGRLLRDHPQLVAVLLSAMANFAADAQLQSRVCSLMGNLLWAGR